MEKYNYEKMICECGKQFITQRSFCSHRGGGCDEFKKLKESILTYNFLYENITINKYPINHISYLIKKEKNIFFSVISIMTQAKKFNIKTPSSSESCSNKITRQKYVETSLKRYGIKNTFQSPKTKETVQKRYGVDNVFQSQRVIDKIQNDEHYLEKYGMTRKKLLSLRNKDNWKNKTEKEKNDFICKSFQSDKACYNRTHSKGYWISNIELKIEKIFIENHINYEKQFCIKLGPKKRKFYDFKLTHNILLEINGDYWHANPQSYKSSDILMYKFGKKTAQDIWNKDLEKNEIAKQHGYDVITLWEKDINLAEKEQKLNEFVNREILCKLNL
jgi:hypothetical protein